MPSGVYKHGPHSKETKRKMSEAAIERYKDSREREKTRRAMNRPGVKAKISKANPYKQRVRYHLTYYIYNIRILRRKNIKGIMEMDGGIIAQSSCHFPIVEY